MSAPINPRQATIFDRFASVFAAGPVSLERQEDIRLKLAALREREGSEARRLAAHLAKNAARRYRRRPALLDAIVHGLSMQAPECVIACAQSLAMVGGRRGPGPLVMPANLRGAVIYARWLRRFEERADALEAAE